MKQKIKDQIKEPLTIPHPEKMTELEPILDPKTPVWYPDENPIEKPKEKPVQDPPYQIPQPNELP
jgi:hypothetical protein